jgi:hypothetical protein
VVEGGLIHNIKIKNLSSVFQLIANNFAHAMALGCLEEKHECKYVLV